MIIARIRRMGEGTVFSLSVHTSTGGTPGLDGGGYPMSEWWAGYPRSGWWGVVPQVWMVGQYPRSGSEGGTPGLDGGEEVPQVMKPTKGTHQKRKNFPDPADERVQMNPVE